MKIFFYALREFDELRFVRECAEEFGFEYAYTTAYPSMDNVSLAAGFEAVSIITNPINSELMDRLYAEGVRYISTRSIGYEHIDTKHARQIGMKAAHVTYSPNSVANYTIMLMLMLCRKTTYILEKSRLQDFALNGKIGKELSESTVGVIGTGNIGATVIRHLSGFGCRMLAYDPYPKKDLEGIASYVDLDTIYREADIITLHVPAMDSNYHMIGRSQLAVMKDGVIIVNAARGALIDTDALIEALESGKVGAAGLDTIEQEAGLYYLNKEEAVLPHRDRALLSAFPNVILSPHMAFYTEQAVRDMVRNSCIGLINFVQGTENPFEVKY